MSESTGSQLSFLNPKRNCTSICRTEQNKILYSEMELLRDE